MECITVKKRYKVMGLQFSRPSAAIGQSSADGPCGVPFSSFGFPVALRKSRRSGRESKRGERCRREAGGGE